LASCSSRFPSAFALVDSFLNAVGNFSIPSKYSVWSLSLTFLAQYRIVSWCFQIRENEPVMLLLSLVFFLARSGMIFAWHLCQGCCYDLITQDSCSHLHNS
jgi:hypothetical protein